MLQSPRNFCVPDFVKNLSLDVYHNTVKICIQTSPPSLCPPPTDNHQPGDGHSQPHVHDITQKLLEQTAAHQLSLTALPRLTARWAPRCLNGRRCASLRLGRKMHLQGQPLPFSACSVGSCGGVPHAASGPCMQEPAAAFESVRSFWQAIRQSVQCKHVWPCLALSTQFSPYQLTSFEQF